MSRFWERVMLALVVCVPVPALALSGLSVPLPSVVERVAAALVPFASTPTIEEDATLASGKIVRLWDGKPWAARTASATKPATIRIVVRRKPAPAPAPKPAPTRTKSVSLAPVSAPPASTVGEDTAVAAAPAAAPAAQEPAPAPAPAPAPHVTERTPVADVGPAEPVDDTPIVDTDVKPDVKPDPATLPPVDAEPAPDETPVEPPRPPLREEKPSTNADSGK
jgi:hypothetical protein